MFIDTHCHLQFSDFDADREEALRRAKKRGVEKIIVPGIDIASSRQALDLARDFSKMIAAAVGIHPYGATKMYEWKEVSELIEAMISEKNIAALGEIGLDYFRFKSNEARHRQKVIFEAQLALAKQKNLPVIIHCREAWDDMLEILAGIKVKGVMHCFSGGRLHLERVLDLGLYLGVDGNITYSKYLQTVLKDAPIERILLETDSPYLTPIPYRGKRNEPAYLPLVAEELARILTVPVEEVEAKTTQNAQELFNL